MNNMGRVPQLSRRLMMAVQMVTKGNTVADIGCDHAHTSIYLIGSDTSPKAIAMDVRKGPLEHAINNVTDYGYEDKIDIRLSDGLDKLKLHEVDTILITGMGGVLMEEILSRGREVMLTAKELVLSPQSHPDKVRRFVTEMGFTIVSEDMCYDDGKYYVVMKAVARGTDPSVIYHSEADFLYGACLIEDRNKVLREYLELERRKTVFVINQMKGQGTSLALKELPKFEHKLEIIESIIW